MYALVQVKHTVKKKTSSNIQKLNTHAHTERVAYTYRKQSNGVSDADMMICTRCRHTACALLQQNATLAQAVSEQKAAAAALRAQIAGNYSRSSGVAYGSARTSRYASHVYGSTWLNFTVGKHAIPPCVCVCV